MKRFLLPLLLIFAGTILYAENFEIDRAQLLQDVKTLSADEMEGREIGTPGNARARAYIIQRFTHSGISPYEKSYEHAFTFTYRKDKKKQEHRGNNVIGFIKGTDSDNLIVITAHYDHLGIKNGQIYNGADDNASGVAALLQVGSYFTKNQPRNSMILAAVDGEEANAESGATRLVEKLDKNKIVMNINLDMVGRDRNNTLYAGGTYHYPFLKPYLQKVAAQSPVKLLFGHDQPNLKDVEDWTRESDHYAFHVRGIPFLYFGVEDFEHHHKPTDDFENMTYDFFADAATTILMATKELDDAGLLPRPQ